MLAYLYQKKMLLVNIRHLVSNRGIVYIKLTSDDGPVVVNSLDMRPCRETIIS